MLRLLLTAKGQDSHAVFPAWRLLQGSLCSVALAEASLFHLLREVVSVFPEMELASLTGDLGLDMCGVDAQHLAVRIIAWLRRYVAPSLWEAAKIFSGLWGAEGFGVPPSVVPQTIRSQVGVCRASNNSESGWGQGSASPSVCLWTCCVAVGGGIV